MKGKNTQAPARKFAADPRDSGRPAPVERNPLVPSDADAATHERTPTTTAGDAVVPRPRKKIDEDKVTVSVHTGFNLTLDHGTVIRYEQGVQEMPKSHAEHWYTQHHVTDEH